MARFGRGARPRNRARGAVAALAADKRDEAVQKRDEADAVPTESRLCAARWDVAINFLSCTLRARCCCLEPSAATNSSGLGPRDLQGGALHRSSFWRVVHLGYRGMRVGNVGARPVDSRYRRAGLEPYRHWSDLWFSDGLPPSARRGDNLPIAGSVDSSSQRRRTFGVVRDVLFVAARSCRRSGGLAWERR